MREKEKAMDKREREGGRVREDWRIYIIHTHKAAAHYITIFMLTCVIYADVCYFCDVTIRFTGMCLCTLIILSWQK